MHDSSTCPICRTLPTGTTLTDSAFDTFLGACRDELATKQERFQQRIGGAARWFYEMADGSLTIGDTRFAMTPIGTYSAAHQSWQWAWANEAFPPVAKESAAAVRDLYAVTGFRVFIEPGINASPADAMSFVALAVHQLGAIGMFRSPSQDTVLYLAAFEPRANAAQPDIRAPAPASRPRSVLTPSECTTREARRVGRVKGGSRESLFFCGAAAPLRRLTMGGEFAPRAPCDPTGRFSGLRGNRSDPYSRMGGVAW